MVIFQKKHVDVFVCGDCFIPGHLIIRPKKPVYSFNEMTTEVLHQLADTLALCQRVIHEVIKPERIYTLSFGEVDPAIHFHMFPRTAKLKQHYHQHFATQGDVNGAKMFDWARVAYQDADSVEYQQVMTALRNYFALQQNH